VTLASCPLCGNQAFRHGATAHGFQFHLDVDKAKINEMVAAFGHRLQVVGVECSQVLHDSEKYLPALQAVAEAVLGDRLICSTEEGMMERIAMATSEDVPQLVALLNLLFTQEADFKPDPAKQERGLRLVIESPQVGLILVAHDGSDIIGMVSLLYTVSTAEGGTACWLEDMVVYPDHHGRGVGSRLLQSAIEYARTNGFTRITLLTDKVNAGAIRFYGRHGFTESAMTALKLKLK
jgi:GNAT superfamily N-acetyltransferase